MARWTDIAQWRGPTVNVGGAMKEHRGLVVHIAEGTFEGTISWQKGAANEVSSHFVVDTDGSIAQVVDTEVTAWTQRAGNGRWLSVENAGHTPHPLTDAQIEANARIFAAAHLTYRVPLQIATSPDGKGLGHHSMGAENGVDWGHSHCPGPAIIAQKPAILARAIQIVEGDDVTKDDIAAIVAALKPVIAAQVAATLTDPDVVKTLATQLLAADVAWAVGPPYGNPDYGDPNDPTTGNKLQRIGYQLRDIAEHSRQAAAQTLPPAGDDPSQ